MTKTRLILLAAMAVATVQGQAFARYPRSGNVSTPWGTFSAAEMNAAGGDVYTAGQLREQRQMMMFQQQQLKQQQQYQNYLKKNPGAAKAAMNQGMGPVVLPKKKRATYDASRPVSASANPTSTTAAK